MTRITLLAIVFILPVFCKTIAAPPDQRKHLVIVIAEREYRTKETLPAFAKRFLSKTFRISHVVASDDDDKRNDLSGIKVLADADVALFSVRRRVPPKAQLDVVRKYIAAGKPVVGIRTSSHAFVLRKGKPPEGHDDWPKWDPEVIGGSYSNHYGGKIKAKVTVARNASKHPILTGVDVSRFMASGGLYKSAPLGKTSTALLMGAVPDHVAEPVAWTNTHIGGGRTFYTSLGHINDFQNDQFNRLLLNGIHWAAGLPVPKSKSKAGQKLSHKEQSFGIGNGLSPQETLKHMTVADDLEVDLVLSEPQITQPVFLNFDERGRMWVVEYRQYPYPAGLKVVSKDKYWRTVFDKVPAAPGQPGFVKGRDRISIHEDSNGDGQFDKHKVFIDGLNIVTSCVRGRGGVWVLNPPYLLFYADKNNDDVPDGDPVIHLQGFGLQDTHSVTNSLRWGPDGWLYASQGSTVSADIIRPGIDKEPVHSMGQLIWRYHPETKRYEIFAEGGGNAFGIEFDDKGRLFSGHNGGDTRGFHYVQGGYYRKGFGKHGPLSNPYAFGYFSAMKHHKVQRFTHNFVIYGGGALPEKYNGKLLGIEPLQGRVVMAEMKPRGSTFETKDIGHPLTCGDKRFRPVDIKVGPDGAIYLADFYEKYPSHRQHYEGNVERETGRIWRIRMKEKKGSPQAPAKNVNRWNRQTTLRLLADKGDSQLAQRLLRQLSNSKGQDALEYLWQLNAVEDIKIFAPALLKHSDPYVRLWTIRLVGDFGDLYDFDQKLFLAQALVDLARVEAHVEVRCQLASTAKRLGKTGHSITKELLLRDVDADDPFIPMLLWWAIESNCHYRDELVDHWPRLLAMLFKNGSAWNKEIVKRHILERLVKRFAMTGSRRDLVFCAKLVESAPSNEVRSLVIKGFEGAYRGRSMPRLPQRLIDAISSSKTVPLFLGIRIGDKDATARGLKLIMDKKVDQLQRVACIQTLGTARIAGSVPALLSVTESEDAAVRRAAYAAIQRFDNSEISNELIGRLDRSPRNVVRMIVGVLATREKWSLQLLEAVEKKKINRPPIPRQTIIQMRRHKDIRIAGMLLDLYGGVQIETPDQMKAAIRKYSTVLLTGDSDPYSGQKLFEENCERCHKLFDKGGSIGPELTAYNRGDTERMLHNIVNPSAEIREGFENYILTTIDGRKLSGFLVDRDAKVTVLRGIDGQDVVVEKDDVDEMRPMDMSLMPEGLLKPYTDQQVRDLFAYLRSAQPLNN